MRVNFFKLERSVFRKTFHARDASTNRSCLHRKTMEKQNKTPVKSYYCMSDISCLHHGDRLKAAVHCLYRIFIVNNSLLVLYLQSF